MKKSFVMLVMVGLLSSMSMPAFAIKPLNDKFTEIYGAADEKDVRLLLRMHSKKPSAIFAMPAQTRRSAIPTAKLLERC